MTTAGSLDDAGPLRGLRVLDVTEEPDALLASSFLADLGADVVMLETAPLGHRARRLGPMKGSVSLLWKVTGRNKRPMGPTASVGGLARRIARSSRRAYWRAGVLSPGRAGLLAARAVTSSSASRRPVNQSLRRRWTTIRQAVLRGMEFLPIFFQQIGFRNERTGIGSSYQVPVATWRTADDKWVTFTGNTNDVVHRLYRAMGRPELIDDPRFATNDGRVANRQVVEATLADWARGLARRDLDEICRQHHVPVGSVLPMADIFEEPNYLERQSIVEVDDAELGPCRLPGVVPRFSRTPGRVDHLGVAAPVLNPAADELWAARRPAINPTRAMSTSGSGPLSGLRVIDMGQILAGPYAATVLADLGADVIKVEKPGLGDDFRRQAPLHRGVSLWWKASAATSGQLPSI
jgi:crotonobetainyl-CoA:carnitine CoA-transferase CaiB-like acyl-CoA transferase